MLLKGILASAGMPYNESLERSPCIPES